MPTPVHRSFVWTSIITLFLDQLTKTVIYGMFARPNTPPSVSIIGNILKISFTTNPSGVFGLKFGPPWFHFLLQGSGIVLLLFFVLRNKNYFLSYAYGIILGGALGNLIDRIRLGYVIDFIDFEIRAIRFRWFTFNLADAFIVIGVIMIFFYEFIIGIKQRKECKSENAGLSGQQFHNPN